MTARRLAIAVLLALVGVALLANFLASDRPLLLKLDGELYVLPNVIAYDRLAGLSGDELRARMDRDDWAVWPPIDHHPQAVRAGGAIEPVAGPSRRHWLGTDDRGRDVLARLIHGARATLLTALGATLLALLVGVGLALLAVWMRRLDSAIVAACDAASAVPALIVVVAAQGVIGEASLGLAIVLIALPRAADTARIARGAIIAALAEPFCAAARALGASRARVVLRHALPQAFPHLAVASAITAATAVLAEASLSFLGFGTPPPTASWGELLKQAHHNGLPWHLVAPAGLAIAATAAALGALAQRK